MIINNDYIIKVLIVSDESCTPYMKPPLTKELWYSDKSISSSGQLIFKTYSGFVIYFFQILEQKRYQTLEKTFLKENMINSSRFGSNNESSWYIKKKKKKTKKKTLISDISSIFFRMSPVKFYTFLLGLIFILRTHETENEKKKQYFSIYFRKAAKCSL